MPPFTQEHEDFRAVVRRWVEKELAPHADEWEASEHFPNSVFKMCGDQGYLGLKFEEEYGGGGGGYLADAVFLEELQACQSGGVAAGIFAHSGLALPPIWKFGTDEQKQRFLVPGIKGDKIGALAITEPDAGSDVAGIRTTATRVEGGWKVNGSKMFITNGVRADFLVTACKTSDAGGHHGMSFLIIERGEGIVSDPIQKMGWHASDTALISFDDVFVPDENLLGEVDKGFYLIMANFQWERLLLALGAVGAMRMGYELTLKFAHERKTFGKPLTGHQVIAHKFADMATTFEASRTLTYNALRLFVEDKNPISEVTMAKLFTQRAAVDLLDECLQIHGGAGYMTEYLIERAVRDVRLGPIGGGTDEIMREILGKTLSI